MASTWGNNVWGANSWQSNVATIEITGLSLTSSVGDGTNMGVPAQGWG